MWIGVNSASEWVYHIGLNGDIMGYNGIYQWVNDGDRMEWIYIYRGYNSDIIDVMGWIVVTSLWPHWKHVYGK